MSGETRNVPAKAAAGSVINPALNLAGEAIMASQIMSWGMAGYLFSASQGLEETDIASVTTEADITPTAALVAPSGNNTIVIPLMVRVALTDDGGGLSTLDVSFTQAALLCATPLVVSGTALNIQNHLTTNPEIKAQAAATHGCTATALLTTDYITVAHDHAINAALTSGLPVFGKGLEKVVDLSSVPIFLTEGAALLIHIFTASSGGKVVPVITWAEIPATAYREL